LPSRAERHQAGSSTLPPRAIETRLERIDLSVVSESDLEAVINNHCVRKRTNDFVLLSTFVSGSDLVLVFQRC